MLSYKWKVNTVEDDTLNYFCFTLNNNFYNMSDNKIGYNFCVVITYHKHLCFNVIPDNNYLRSRNIPTIMKLVVSPLYVGFEKYWT